jgi:hypothetical protein
MSQDPDALTAAQREVFDQLKAGQQMPPGIYVNERGGVRVNAEELQPGMPPVKIEHATGVVLVNEDGAFYWGHDGSTHAYWRDGAVDTRYARVERVAVAGGVELAQHRTIALGNGTEYRWDFVPHGTLRMIFDAAGKLDEVIARGVRMHCSEGTLTVLQVA